LLDYSDKIHEKAGKEVMSLMALYGAYHLAKPTLFFLRRVMKYCLLPRRNNFALYSGGWALVTGASDGMGKALVEELASQGFDIILMARNE